jgi:transposase
MQAVTRIGLDIAKSVFQVHGVDAEGKVIIRRKLKRRQRPCTNGSFRSGLR